MNSIKIISDGHAVNTRVLNSEGQQIDGITSITIDPIHAGELVTAAITFTDVELELRGGWETHPLKQWANRKTMKSRGD